METPRNRSQSGAALAAEAQTTPVTAKPEHRYKGKSFHRERVDDVMTHAPHEKSRWHEIPVSKFMDGLPKGEFVVEEHIHNITLDHEPFDVKDKKSKNEKATYPVLAAFINKAFEGGSARLICKDVSDWEDRNVPVSRSADLMVYRKPIKDHPTPWDAPSLSKEPDVHQDRVPHAAPSDFSKCLMTIEPKLDSPGFRETDAGKDLLKDTAGGIKTRGQVAEYTAEILARQHRTFVFTVIVNRATARLMRWTHNGCIVSQVINLTADEGKIRLYEFFWRLRNATDAELGLDPTATMLTEDALGSLGVEKAYEEWPEWTRSKEVIKAAFFVPKWPVYRLEVPDWKNPEKRHTFIVRNPIEISLSPVGRSNKPYIAYDEQAKTFTFMKDAWRSVSPQILGELDVYKTFDRCEQQIKNIATVVCGGDLADSDGTLQMTNTDILLDPPGYLPLVHTRMALKEVCVPLRYYRDSHEMCTGTFDAMKAHLCAYIYAGIAHRDISDKNIMLYEDPMKPEARAIGLLVDWDLCRTTDQLSQGPVQANRSGTWRYLSAALLNYPLKPYELADDIESFYHVLSLFAFRFHAHSLSGQPEDMGMTLGHYDVYTFKGGFWTGGATKLQHVEDGTLPFKLTNNDAFSKLLKTLGGICKRHYEDLNKANIARYGLPSQSTSASQAQQEKRSPHSQQELDEWRELSALIKKAQKPASGAHPQTPSVDAHTAGPAVADVPAQSSSSEVTKPVTETPVSTLPLSTHDAFMNAFVEALFMPPLKDQWTKSDKTDDQFALIPLPTIHTTAASTKRSATMAGLDNDGKPSKKNKPTNLDNTVQPKLK